MRTDQRWMACRNMSKLTAPPFALMRLRSWSSYGSSRSTDPVAGKSVNKVTVPDYQFALGYDTDGIYRETLDLSEEVVAGYDVGMIHAFGQVNIGGQMVWDVLIPDADAELNQDQHFLVANGPQPIYSGGYGLCTQDWPARVLHYDNEDIVYTNGLTLGAHNGSWCAWNCGVLEDSALILLSHDATYPGADPQGYPKNHVEPSANPHAVWVRGANGTWTTYYSGTGGSPHAAGTIIPITGVPFTSPTGVTNAHLNGMTLSGGGFVASETGPHLFGFQATLSSDTAPIGAKLGLKLYIGSAATNWEAYRLQDIEQDTQYQATPLLYTAENVACSGLVFLNAGQVVYVKSSSLYEMEVGGFSFWAARTSAP